MRAWRGIVVVVLAGACTALAACSLLTDFGSLQKDGGDAATSDDAPLPATGFKLALSPTHVTADPGDMPVTIKVTVLRAVGFNDRVTFQIAGGVAGATYSMPSDVEPGATTTTFTVGVDKTAVTNGIDNMFTVKGQTPDGKYIDTAKLGLWIGSQLVPNEAGTIVVPPFATSIDVKAWGGGGAGGQWTGNGSGGTNGGGAGFAGAKFTVTPGAQLVVVTATGGAVGNGGGGGGGYSALRDVDGGFWIVAGGGGGGCSATMPPSGPGGAGGGAVAQPGGGCGGGGGATTTSPGAAGVCSNNSGGAGAMLIGGDAKNGNKAVRGMPGGGAGGPFAPAAGGGGGGWYGGGAGGASFSSGVGGGGGGSGYIADGGANAMMLSGSMYMAGAMGDPDRGMYVGNGGYGSPDGVLPSGPGGGGLVLVRLPKP